VDLQFDDDSIVPSVMEILLCRHYVYFLVFATLKN
jgi:hypothetical protein